MTCVCVCACSLSHGQLFSTPWTVVHQAPLSMGFSRQEHWSGLPFPSPGDLPTQGSNPHLLHWQAWILYNDRHLRSPHTLLPPKGPASSPHHLAGGVSSCEFSGDLRPQYTLSNSHPGSLSPRASSRKGRLPKKTATTASTAFLSHCQGQGPWRGEEGWRPGRRRPTVKVLRGAAQGSAGTGGRGGGPYLLPQRQSLIQAQSQGAELCVWPRGSAVAGPSSPGHPKPAGQ